MRGAVVEELDVKAVARPVHARRGGGHADRQRPLVADRQLDENMGQGVVGHDRAPEPGRGLEDAHERERRELSRQNRE